MKPHVSISLVSFLVGALALQAQTSSSGSGTGSNSSTGSSGGSYQSGSSGSSGSTGSSSSGGSYGSSQTGSGSSSSRDTSMSSSGSGSMNSSGDKLSWTDKRFVTKAADDGKAEVQIAQLAAQRATNPDVKQFAERMVRDHTAVNQELMGIASSKNVKLDQDNDKDRAYNKLAKKSGEDFDREFVQHMVDEHEKDVKLFEKAASDAKDPEIRGFASKHVGHLREHLQIVQGLQASVMPTGRSDTSSGRSGTSTSGSTNSSDSSSGSTSSGVSGSSTNSSSDTTNSSGSSTSPNSSGSSGSSSSSTRPSTSR
jgi:putative membrane protein